MAPAPLVCVERFRLTEELRDAIRELAFLQGIQTQAAIEGRILTDDLKDDIAAAQLRKEAARDRLLVHVRTHHCEE